MGILTSLTGNKQNEDPDVHKQSVLCIQFIILMRSNELDSHPHKVGDHNIKASPTGGRGARGHTAEARLIKKDIFRSYSKTVCEIKKTVIPSF